jgi:VanZ family protein
MDRSKLLAVLWTFIMIMLLSIPASEIPSVGFQGIDKVVHFSIFFVMAILWLRAFPDRLAVVIVGVLVFAMMSELYQGMLPIGRQPSVGDVVANSVGMISGTICYLLLMRSGSASRNEGRRDGAPFGR